MSLCRKLLYVVYEYVYTIAPLYKSLMHSCDLKRGRLSSKLFTHHHHAKGTFQVQRYTAVSAAIVATSKLRDLGLFEHSGPIATTGLLGWPPPVMLQTVAIVSFKHKRVYHLSIKECKDISNTLLYHLSIKECKDISNTLLYHCRI